MFSSISGRINDVERQVGRNKEALEYLHTLLSENDDERQTTSKREDSDGTASEARQLLRTQAQMKELNFKVNGILNLVFHHNKEIDLLSRDTRHGGDCQSHVGLLDRDFEQNGVTLDVNQDNTKSASFVYNPLASEFKPSCKNWDLGPALGSNSNHIQNDKCDRVDTVTNNMEDLTEDVGTKQETEAEEQPPTELPPHTTIRTGESGGAFVCNEEVSALRRKVYELEAILRKKDDLIDKLSAEDVDLSAREKEFAHKQDWFEHKMRLLKQDKRRRGETIGKLLRCIDDMKDQGRIDESKVTEGRHVLQATLQTRGWNPEERIRATVHAMEADRASGRAHCETDRVTSESVILRDNGTQ